VGGSGPSVTWRRWTPVLVPSALALVVLALGHPVRAAVLAAVAALVAVLILFGVPVDRYLARVGHLVAHAVSVVATGLVGLVLVVVGGCLWLVGADPLTPRSLQGNGWLPAAPAAASDRLAASPFGLEPGSPATGVPDPRFRVYVRRTVLALGTVAALVLADVGLGLAWERLSGSGTRAEGQVDAVNFTNTGPTVEDPRADLPAMAAYPWAKAYFREIQQTRNSYWPFTESRPLSYRGTYVNILGWDRKTYVAPDAGPDVPVVWMFGGSTAWGEGQRDDHTIASELSRAADAAGMPITVKNYGQRGWTHFQEMVLFEQLLAQGPAPDVALFYDGANEVNAQSLTVKGVPTHTLSDQYAERLTGSAPVGVQTTAGPGLWSQAWDAYRQHAATQKVVGFIDDHVFQPAGAVAATGSGRDARSDTYNTTIEDAQRAVAVYERGRAITGFLAHEHDVDAVFLWQPMKAGGPQAWTNDHVSAPTVNISDALEDHLDVFIDGSHTNERGAEIVARRIWREIEPKARRLEGHRAGAGDDTSTTTTEPPATTVPAAKVVADARAALDRSKGDPCTLEPWKVWLGSLKADTPTDGGQIADLAAEYLVALADAAPPGSAAGAATLRRVAAELPTMAATATVDPKQPFVPQLPVVADATSGFLPTFQSVSSAVAATCKGGG
jgi:hypothetical protein